MRLARSAPPPNHGATSRFIFFCCLTILLSACQKTAVYSLPPSHTSTKQHASRLAKLNRQFAQWRGVPHRTGGLSKRGIDCSGFVYLTFKDLFHLTLPRATKGQSRAGRQIAKRDLRPGDLVFFKIPGKGRHVGITTRPNTFIHTSSSKGVMASNLNNPYWQKTYWQSRRVLP